MKLFRIILFILLYLAISCQPAKKYINVIPKPESVTIQRGNYKIADKLNISTADTVFKRVIETFTKQLGDLKEVVLSNDPSYDIKIQLEKTISAEDYHLTITKDNIILLAGDPHGAFNGLQTLRQMILFGEKTNGFIEIPCCEIKDSPRFTWRGYMVDESRHFFGKEKIMQLIDIMSLHKLNTFHWHLTDEPGWRIEIKKYPDLTLIGGKGNYHDPEAPPVFYTQADIREIAAYAEDRFIKIIPEVDMPGHARAANQAYPEFSGGGSPKYPDFTFNPGKEGTYAYLTDIFREISQIIPTDYLHIGGDEVHFGNEQWNTDAAVQTLMKREHLQDLKAVETYFNQRMADSVKNLGKTLVGWDEIVETGLDPTNSIVMWWRHDRINQLEKALDKNYKVVLCPRIPLYFDFVQDTTHQWGRKSREKGCILENVYNFPPDTLPGIQEDKDQVLGIQANLWTEIIHNNERFDFMTYPRISALAEAGWTKAPQKDYQDFVPRMKLMLSYFRHLDLYYYDPFEPEKTKEPVGVKKR